MNTVKDFLNKLDIVNWNEQSRRDDKLIGINEATGDKFTFSLDTVFAQNYHDINRMPVQIVARVTINGNYASSWGADGNDDCAELVKYYRVHEAICAKAEMDIDKINRSESELIWKFL